MFIFNLHVDQYLIKVCSWIVVKIILCSIWYTWYLLTCIQEQHLNQFIQLMTYYWYTKGILFRKLILDLFKFYNKKKMFLHIYYIVIHVPVKIFIKCCILFIFILSQILIIHVYTYIFKWIYWRISCSCTCTNNKELVFLGIQWTISLGIYRYF